MSQTLQKLPARKYEKSLYSVWLHGFSKASCHSRDNIHKQIDSPLDGKEKRKTNKQTNKTQHTHTQIKKKKKNPNLWYSHKRHHTEYLFSYEYERFS